MTKIKTKPNRFLFNFNFLNYFILFLIIFSGLYYLIGTIDLSVKGYLLGELKKKKTSLAKDQEDAELKVMTLSSYKHLNLKIKEMKMIAVGEIKYLTIPEPTMAKK